MRVRQFVTSIMFCALPFSSDAIVNVESMHLKTPKEGFSGQLGLGLDGNSGNSDNFSSSIGSTLQWHHAPTTYLLSFSGEYGESFGQENINNTFFHLRRIHELTDSRAREIFGQIEQDKFARLNYRGLIGGGMRFKLSVAAKNQAVFLGVGAFYSEEQLSSKGGLADKGTASLVRGNFYLVIKKQLNKSVFVSSTTYIQPNVEDVSDFRALEDAQLGVNLSDTLSLSLKVVAKHDNRPPISVKKTDVSYKTALQYQF